ncbi:hypothetical protein [Bernardetia sp.]|uniref:hypothetical protein n=1 Tax=Bernardetia sp. TaxID=1937974 RepID=UPI0025BAA37B|nr:hypothetical protein [Bernardetia sp.]
MKNTLSYKTQTTLEELEGAMQSQKFYFDFMIDRKPLSKILGAKEDGMIGVLSTHKHGNYEIEKISELLLEKCSELENGRVMLYGCAECLDIMCGAITVKVEEINTSVIWSDFAYENEYEEPNFEPYKNIGSFEFDKETYKKLFTEMKYLY